MFDSSSSVGAAFVNHAHNDWLELTLELGILFPVIAVLFLIVILKSQWRNGLSSLAILIVIALLLHSLVDYPLRTIAIGIVFAFASGILISNKEMHLARP
jgi:O-antigen ligase